MKASFKVRGADSMKSAIAGLSQFADDVAGDLPKDFAQAVSDHIAERAVDNAPIWQTRLRPAIESEPVKKQGSKVTGRVGVASNIFWAFVMHEQLLPYGTGPYELGPISKIMPSTPEGGVGGMFIVRVAQFHKSQYEQALAGAVNSILKTRRNQKFTFRP